MIDPLEVKGRLTPYDYEYLSGKWEGSKGSAFAVVYEWCKNHGYGYYGEPTETGKREMARYERSIRSDRSPVDDVPTSI